MIVRPFRVGTVTVCNNSSLWPQSKRKLFSSGVPEVERGTEAESEEDLGAEIEGAPGVEAGAGGPARPVLAAKPRRLRIGLGPKRKQKVGTAPRRRKRTRTTRRTRKRRMPGTLIRISWKKK